MAAPPQTYTTTSVGYTPNGSGAAQSAAASAASLQLHHYQQMARREGEREFDDGVGARQRQQDELLPRVGGGAQLARKRRKTRSAYVSRYAAKTYTKLLERHVAREHESAAATRAQLEDQAERHARARAILASVEAAVARTNGPSRGTHRPLLTGFSAPIASGAAPSAHLHASLPAQQQPHNGSMASPAPLWRAPASQAMAPASRWPDMFEVGIASRKDAAAVSDVSDDGVFSRVLDNSVQ